MVVQEKWDWYVVGQNFKIPFKNGMEFLPFAGEHQNEYLPIDTKFSYRGSEKEMGL